MTEQNVKQMSLILERPVTWFLNVNCNPTIWVAPVIWVRSFEQFGLETSSFRCINGTSMMLTKQRYSKDLALQKMCLFVLL